jgi:hypothetical protein
MARSRNTADTQTASGGPVSPSIAGKNAVINGGMDIWQRGTSFTVASTTQTYTTDRWMAYRAATGATVTRQNTSPNYSPYYVRVARDSGNTSTNIIYLTQSIETLNSRPLAGKTITLSWWARVGANYSNASSQMTFELNYGTGTDQNLISGFTGQTVISSATPTVSTTWQKFTYTGTVSTSATQVGVIFYWYPTGTAGAADYLEIADVQIELGSVATPFSRAGGTIQGELAACQRYYWRLTPAQNESVYGISIATSTSGASASVNNPVPMRVIPTSVDFSALALLLPAVAFYAASGLTIATNGSSQNVVTITLSASGLTNGRWYFLTNNGGSTGYLGFSAEL